MGRTVVIFRVSLVAYALLVSAALVKALLIGHGHLPEAALAYLKWWRETPQSTVERAVGWIGLVATASSIVSALAMTIFARWARPAFAACTVLTIALTPFMDFPVLKTPGEDFLEELWDALAGAPLVLFYLSKTADPVSGDGPPTPHPTRGPRA